MHDYLTCFYLLCTVVGGWDTAVVELKSTLPIKQAFRRTFSTMADWFKASGFWLRCADGSSAYRHDVQVGDG